MLDKTPIKKNNQKNNQKNIPKSNQKNNQKNIPKSNQKNNLKKKNFFKKKIKATITVKNLKKKIILKKKLKKKFSILKKKKLNIVYNNLCLGNKTLLYRLHRKLLKKKLLLQSTRKFLKLKNKLKKLSLINDNTFFLRLISFTTTNFKFSKKKNNIKIKKNSIKLKKIKKNSIKLKKNKKIITKNKKIKINKKKIKFCLNITVHSNNIFINLAKYFKPLFKTVKFWSAGFFDFICSKTKLKFAISTMLKEVKSKLKKLKIYIIKIQAPKHLNKYIFKQLLRLFYKTKFLIYTSFKIFNGCRSSKKRRKKRLKFRFFR